jgi:FkbM family methyltransferase
MLDSQAIKILLQRDPLLYVDAGARGDLEGGWRDFPPGCLSVLAFEPDEKAAIDWEGSDRFRHVERSALWSSETEVEIHIGKVGSTSSVWPPDMDYLARFAQRHVEPRTTQSVSRVKAKTLDQILHAQGIRADFLKIDTQGAELQILQGASKALDTDIMGAVVETWTVPIHKGQGLTQDIMSLMYAKGFIVCGVEVAAAWDRKVTEHQDVSYKRQIVGLDILFLKDPVGLEEHLSSTTKAAKFAVIAQMYGHYDLALEALDMAMPQELDEKNLLSATRQDIVAAHALLKSPPPSRRGLLDRIRNRMHSARPSQKLPTKLHY